MCVVENLDDRRDQIRMAVVDAGSYAKAAEVLHKSQSSLTYAVQKLESLLGVKAFVIQGRKSVLTPTGQLLYRRARALLNDASGLEQAARTLSAGWEAEIFLAVKERVLRDCVAAADGGHSLATGDGANDIPMLQAAHYGVAYHAKPKARAAANGAVDHGDLTSVLRLLGIAQSEWA